MLISGSENFPFQTTPLPIGSVVKLKNVQKLVMIYGRHQRETSSDKIFDYVSVPYPEGNISDDFNLFFNRNMIEDVKYIVFETPQEDLREKGTEEMKVYSEQDPEQ
ncbi:DUF4176 domain-containing protein [Bacillus sp. FJAT-47783]|uniref:DUF4176 domain-containing protein n=1 Tax=Bacillus sp. FJAT-47783 TaxID=2922712 RepID=UPI001FAE6AF8